jgi:hypothetical protein
MASDARLDVEAGRVSCGNGDGGPSSAKAGLCVGLWTTHVHPDADFDTIVSGSVVIPACPRARSALPCGSGPAHVMVMRPPSNLRSVDSSA